MHLASRPGEGELRSSSRSCIMRFVRRNGSSASAFAKRQRSTRAPRLANKAHPGTDRARGMRDLLNYTDRARCTREITPPRDYVASLLPSLSFIAARIPVRRDASPRPFISAQMSARVGTRSTKGSSCLAISRVDFAKRNEVTSAVLPSPPRRQL